MVAERIVFLFGASLLCLSVGCSSPQPQPPASKPSSSAAKADKLPDPGEKEAQEVRDFVGGWVKSRLDAEGRYDIPAKAGHDVSGLPADFHTVHQKDAQTYFVCLDFKDGDALYDVDFFVSRGDDGLKVSDHYLHKINGKALAP